VHVVFTDQGLPCPGGVRDIRCGIKCVSDLLICDGVADCPDGTDEKPSLCDHKGKLYELNFLVPYQLIEVCVSEE